MKQFNFLSFLFIFTFIFLNAENNYAQQVNKNYVVVEIGTGTWCGFCPGAAMGADDLVHNGHQVAVIENHNGDSHTYAGSNARNSYYGISGYPTAFFNGGNSVVGGSHTNSMYESYLPKYDAAIAVMSDFTLELSYTHTGSNYDVTIDIDEVGTYTGTNLAIHLVLTESHVAENWQGQTELNFISRAMYPTQTGTAYTGNATTLNLSFTADAAWDLSNCELVAFIQDNSTKNILQADKISLAQPTGTNNIGILSVNDVPSSCNLLVSPSLMVKNYGSDDITSLTIDYSINGGNTTGTYNWNGSSISMFDQAIITLENLSFAILNATNPIEFEITHVNGVADDDTSNNTANSSFDEASTAVDHNIQVFIQTGNNGNECTWEITDSSGIVVESGGPYGNNENINELYSFPQDCYTFTVYDSGGNGGETIIVADANSNPLYYSTGGHGAEESQEFSVPLSQGVEDIAFADSLIYPNPANSELNIKNAEGLNISLYDILGRKLLSKDSISIEEQINISDFAEGTYFLTLSDGNKIRTEQIIITK